MTEPSFLDEPPQKPALTTYDRQHMKLYTRLLDAAADGATWQEAAAVLFGIDPLLEPVRARKVHDGHLARARWVSESGYRQLIGEGNR
ncbi:DUF2285 domain-containing protein [Sinorhizobium sp. 8-89]|uniref:DNA -binding domain-containing protein n=1 Tax=Sinorhizobium sp. 7-81 TaxID=3049087 RepID=UPI0024C438DA|nr:DUF2285 domain-containing protein [Sinorhizobium sp. 7-81]